MEAGVRQLGGDVLLRECTRSRLESSDLRKEVPRLCGPCGLGN
jgi:hypothetical protein